MASPLLLAIDQGTTSSRAIAFDINGGVHAVAQQELPQSHSSEDRVEQDGEDIWRTVLETARKSVEKTVAEGKTIHAVGITNQRETTLLWEKESGTCIHPAIVWQDRRTSKTCEELRNQGVENEFSARTGLRLNPYFSCTKLAWLLENVPGARASAEAGRLAFGTVDSFLLYRLTGGRIHATDSTNASRTGLYNIHTMAWDEELLRLFGIPAVCLPEVHDSCADYSTTAVGLLPVSLPLRAVIGDQQSAALGQGCTAPGMMKSTYGTGCFLLSHTGTVPVASQHDLLTTIAYCVDGETCYALEGSIFVAGAAIQWLRDRLGILADAKESEDLAQSLAGNGGVYFVPAFTGLGAPYWDAEVRGGIFGLTLDSGAAHLTRAALESVAYQSADLLAAVKRDGVAAHVLRIDGGMSGNDWLAQFLCDMIGIPVERAAMQESTALGACYLAALGVGLLENLHDIARVWRGGKRFIPQMETRERDHLLESWRRAVTAARSPL